MTNPILLQIQFSSAQGYNIKRSQSMLASLADIGLNGNIEKSPVSPLFGVREKKSKLFLGEKKIYAINWPVCVLFKFID